MTPVNLPKTNQTGANEWADVEDNDVALRDVINGGLDNSNIAAAAGIVDSKLASPNNSTYKTLLTGGSMIGADAAAATYLLVPSVSDSSGTSTAPFGGMQASGANFSTTLSAAHLLAPAFIYFDNADVTVSSLTEKLRVRAQVNTNATAWSAVTATFGLYPVTFAGAADQLTVTLGTVVSGSTVAIANPSASTTNQGNSGDFTVPSDGQYCLGVVTSATLTNNAAALLTAQLQTRNT